jgi:alpha-1,3-glucan synthase
MKAYSFKALVPKKNWIEMYPVITSFKPGHDSRILSTNGSASIPLELKFSQNMSCETVTKGIKIKSTTEVNLTPAIDPGSVSCSQISPPDDPKYSGALGSAWVWQGTLINVPDGVHQVSLTNISNSDGTDSTRVCFRNYPRLILGDG